MTQEMIYTIWCIIPFVLISLIQVLYEISQRRYFRHPLIAAKVIRFERTFVNYARSLEKLDEFMEKHPAVAEKVKNIAQAHEGAEETNVVCGVEDTMDIEFWYNGIRYEKQLTQDINLESRKPTVMPKEYSEGEEYYIYFNPHSETCKPEEKLRVYSSAAHMVKFLLRVFLPPLIVLAVCLHLCKTGIEKPSELFIHTFAVFCGGVVAVTIPFLLISEMKRDISWLIAGKKGHISELPVIFRWYYGHNVSVNKKSSVAGEIEYYRTIETRYRAIFEFVRDGRKRYFVDNREYKHPDKYADGESVTVYQNMDTLEIRSRRNVKLSSYIKGIVGCILCIGVLYIIKLFLLKL